jgi:membrane-bound ClpP family serine protease
MSGVGYTVQNVSNKTIPVSDSQMSLQQDTTIPVLDSLTAMPSPVQSILTVSPLSPSRSVFISLTGCNHFCFRFTNCDSVASSVNSDSIATVPKQISFQKDFRDKFLSAIADPNVAYILLLIGIYGIFFEFLNPGSIGPGVIGAISLLVAMISLNMLPVNTAGVVLIILGIIFMVAEVFVPSFGILGIGGTISFVIGSLILFETQTLAYGVSIPLILAFSITSLLLFMMVVRLVLKSRKMPVVSGSEEMIGKQGIVLKKQKNGRFLVRVHGEQWQAESKEELVPHEGVTVVEIKDLILQIKKEEKD